jgi:predicted AAA+ superfamily ATPase
VIERKLEETIIEMLQYFRVVTINGPRQSGKTTLQKKIAQKLGMDYYTFDNPSTYALASDNTENFLRNISRDQHVAIDEVQMVPDMVPAIKMAVDEANRKGMFLLTGSSDMFRNARIKESLAGRMASFNLYPLSYAEINGRDINVIDKFFGDDFARFDRNFAAIPEREWIEAVINGGYPEVYLIPQRAKKAWFAFYIQSRIAKDIAMIDNIQLDKISHLDKLLRVLASQVASLVNYTHIANAIGLADKTVQKYIQLLEALYIVKLVPAYSSNQLKRVVKKPKVHFIDSGLASYLLNVDAEASVEGRNSHLGNLVETFVYSELIKHQSFSQNHVEIYHYRDADKREVDFVLESSCGDVVALEIKSGSSLKPEHFKGLGSLAKNIQGKSFRGILLYGGNTVLPYTFGQHTFWAIPLKILI